MESATFANQTITLADEIGKGGEATIYNVAAQSDWVAKLYHQPTSKREAKLWAMLRNPPEQPQTHVTLAWPTALLYRQQTTLQAITSVDGCGPNSGQFVGFLMPKIVERQTIFQIYNPVMRRRLPYPVNWHTLHRVAFNLCALVEAAHEKGYVIGDINESNILVNRDGLITIVDCDSFQVTDQTGHVHRCRVGKPEFTPPELQGVRFDTIDQLPAHDLFGLGVLLFQLLMEGYHPFAGVLNSQASVGRVDLYAIRQGMFPYGKDLDINPPPASPDFFWLHPELQTLFLACFESGHTTPTSRPSGREWQAALQVAESNLRHCQKADHVHSAHLNSCPHCDHPKFKLGKHFFNLAQLTAKGKQAYQKGKRAEVIATLTPLVATANASADVYAYLAWAYEHKKSQKAIDYAEQALYHDPGHALAYYIKGASHYKKWQYKQAIADLTQAIKLGYDPISAVYYKRALAYRESGYYNLAWEDVQNQLSFEMNKKHRQRGLALQKKLRPHRHQIAVSIPLTNTQVPIPVFIRNVLPPIGLVGLALLVVWMLAGNFVSTIISSLDALSTDQDEQFPTEAPFAVNQMVLVPAGLFDMGGSHSEGFSDYKPVHTIYLNTFQIDPYEVTNAQYRACFETGPCRYPALCSGHAVYNNPKKSDHPVVCVNWQHANDYCRWAKKRLPTEAEWEKAARGTDNRIYPWGEELRSDRANYNNQVGTTTAVGSYRRGVSPYGVHDMVGNVSEWVADWYSEDYYRISPTRNPIGPLSGKYRVMRGGSYQEGVYDRLTAYSRSRFLPTQLSNTFGFRCARTPTADDF